MFFIQFDYHVVFIALQTPPSLIFQESFKQHKRKKGFRQPCLGLNRNRCTGIVIKAIPYSWTLSNKYIFFLHWNCTIKFLWIYHAVSCLEFCLFLLCAKQNNTTVMTFYTSLLDLMISTSQMLINCHNEPLGWMSLKCKPKQHSGEDFQFEVYRPTIIHCS